MSKVGASAGLESGVKLSTAGKIQNNRISMEVRITHVGI
jgi:hypothetical protein